ncbi:myc-type, basic helix-loop-helix (bHLH) domain-containing protein [Artemisia annua]|uniref:Myc-type, basic helix-loop-helix (BHLH) domain-containing protein n=1 Tax=Artemisia annua TaxID=35608 RepID=A0A2U1L096_ARTAN|nr:myc-type, basic helix-loop-helix (bHLH) domain-containing protein [Artemisia annua]
MLRNPLQAQDHVLAERKRREKLNRHFISLSAIIPNLTKMDKASVLEDASKYIKELQDRVKELEESPSIKRNHVHESVISVKRSRLSASDDEYYSSNDTNSEESTAPYMTSPEIEVRMSGSSVLVSIKCQNNISSFTKALDHMEKLGLSIISCSSMPFAKTNLLIGITAQVGGQVRPPRGRRPCRPAGGAGRPRGRGRRCAAGGGAPAAAVTRRRARRPYLLSFRDSKPKSRDPSSFLDLACLAAIKGSTHAQESTSGTRIMFLGRRGRRREKVEPFLGSAIIPNLTKIEDDFCMTTTELVKSLQLAL